MNPARIAADGVADIRRGAATVEEALETLRLDPPGRAEHDALAARVAALEARLGDDPPGGHPGDGEAEPEPGPPLPMPLADGDGVILLTRGRRYAGPVALAPGQVLRATDGKGPRPIVEAPRRRGPSAVTLSSGCAILGIRVIGGHNGILITGAGNRVADCAVEGSNQHGVFCEGGDSRDNIVEHTVSHGHGRVEKGARIGHGFSQQRGARDNVIRFCRGHDNVEDGAQQGSAAGGAFVLKDCRFDRNGEDGVDTKSRHPVICRRVACDDNAEHGFNLGRVTGQVVTLEDCSAAGNGHGPRGGEAINLDYGVTAVVRGGTFVAGPGQTAIQVRQVRRSGSQADALRLDMAGATVQSDTMALVIDDGRLHRVVDCVLDGPVHLSERGRTTGAPLVVARDDGPRSGT
ncbi:MAG: right-handed parallel beta-helix repeat-containing protein [Inquilinaceae bacterium]